MKKRNKRGVLRITTIVLVVIIISVGSLMDLLIQKLEKGVLEVCATQQEAYVQLVVDQINLKQNRDEEEILGYRNVLNLIHDNYQYIPVKSTYLLQMHRDLLQFTNLSFGGHFKNTANEIDMILSNGEKKILFTPIAPYETPTAVENLCDTFQKAISLEIVDDLILISCFILVSDKVFTN